MEGVSASLVSQGRCCHSARAFGSTGTAVHLFVWRLIDAPVRALVDHARRVAEGDFAPRIKLRNRQDELGMLAKEMNAMTQQLAAAEITVRRERQARTATLEKLRHADRLSTVGRIASSIAHELGTPLNVISGRASMILEDTEDSQVEEHATIIADQVQRVTAIIRELLDYARSSDLRLADVAIAEVVEHATTLLEPVAEQADVCLVSKGSPDVRAHLDSGRILQVLTNLMTNAIQAMSDGGTLTVRHSVEQVEMPPEKHAEGGVFLRLDVEDTGIGIVPERIAKIFEAFYTTKRSGEGTGLGLSVCQGIAREHGGWIAVRSEVGEGTCFSCFFPQEAAHSCG